MAPRVLLVLGMLLLVCLVKVSSDLKVEEGIVEEEELHFPNEPLIVRDGNRRLMQDIDCGGLCKTRCSAHSRPNLCSRACGTCCVRCKCVPPGTSGNRELCGTCYTDMTTHANKTKCP
ncbi:Snakin-2 protein [Spatholobus suberectus]|nr:Snakin-2 protein [Spatholobus suberectus]